MGSPRFETLGQAKAWLYEDAITDGVAPFLGFLGGAEIDELRAYLDAAVASHPRLKTVAFRAAKSLVEVVPLDEEQPIAEAARKAKPRAGKKPLELPYEGAPEIAAAKFHKAALPIVTKLAKRVSMKWHYDEKELVAIGWLTAVEIAPTWKANVGTFEKYLWRCAWNRMTDTVKSLSNRRERPCGGSYPDQVEDEKEDDAERQFRSETKAFAAAYVVESMCQPDPEKLNEDKERLTLLYAASEKLPEKHRALFASVYVDGLTLEEARTELGLADSTARLMHRDLLAFLSEAVNGKSNVRPLKPKAKPPER
jgi:RNA polymerase sigma factor (sigma-70 family)